MTEEMEKSQAIREISEATWADKPVIAVFGLDGPYYIGKNRIAALNYQDLEAEARALVQPLRDQLMLQDLGFQENEEGELSVTFSDEEEDEEETAVSGHHFFTCPRDLADRAIFLHVGMQVRGKDAIGKEVQGEITGGNWRWVFLRGDAGEPYPYVPVETLEIINK